MEANQDTSAGLHEPKPKRTRKRTTAAPVKVEKRSLNLRLDPADYSRLCFHATEWRMTVSDLVAKLTREHCTEFDLHRRGRRGDSAGE